MVNFWMGALTAMSVLALGNAVRNIEGIKNNTEAIDDILVAMLDKEA